MAACEWIQMAGAENTCAGPVDVITHDQVPAAEIRRTLLAGNYDCIVLSPGPGKPSAPEDVGMSVHTGQCAGYPLSRSFRVPLLTSTYQCRSLPASLAVMSRRTCSGRVPGHAAFGSSSRSMRCACTRATARKDQLYFP